MCKLYIRAALICLLALGVFGPSLGEPLRATAPENGNALGWSIEYDDADLISKITGPAGRETRIDYGFDENNRLRRLVITAADGSAVIREFDERGRLSAMTDNAGGVAYGYDELDRLNRVQRDGAPAITYTYDTLDRIKALEVGDFYRIEYTYDFLNRLVFMDTPAGVVRYDYLTGQGKVVRTLPNGLKTIWEYSADGDLHQITHGLARSPDDSRYAVLAEYIYQFRPDGLIAAIKERSSAGEFLRSYEYDQVGRLVRAKGPPGKEYAYAFDAVGNRVKALATGQAPQNLAYDWAGRLTSVEGRPVVHDAAGNLTKMSAASKTLRYGYNQANQLVEVLGAKVAYRYDGDGQLIARTTGRLETTFIPNPLSAYWQPLVMEDNAGHRTLVVWEGTTPLISIQDGKAEFMLHDHLGSVRMVMDRQGRLSRRIDYEPFGAITDSAMEKEFAPRFAGLFWEPIEGIYLTRARAYSPQLGRFLQIDPQHRIAFGSQKDLSVYAYCGSDPLNLVDRDGQAPEPPPYALLYAKAFMTELPNTIGESINSAVTFWSQAFHGGVEFGAQPGSLADQARLLGGARAEQAVQALSGISLISSAVALSAKYGVSIAIGSKSLFSKGVHHLSRFSHNLFKKGGIRYYSGRAPKNPIDIFKWQQSAAARGDILLFHHTSRAGGNYTLNLAKAKIPRKAIAYGVLGLTAGMPTLMLGNLAFNPDDASKTYFGVPNPSITPSRHSIYSGTRSLEFHAPKSPAAPETASGIDPQRLQDARALADVIMKQIDAAKDAIRTYDISGGDWRVAGPGGRASPDAYAALDEFRRTSSFAPSTVGGIYLGGAGQSLDAIGLIEGIALDANNSLVLLDQAGESIDLPPLRLDDVVTVFRSVYLHGEGPTVTIDPNPENPEGSAMIIRHGKATENTYVGWVLFQADRLMKGYTLGADNETAKDISTRVPGYDKVLSTIYFGGGSPEKRRKQGHWERFWIVPAQANRFAGAKQELTLFDVPLKVKTQTMKWQNGELVDDLDGKSSPGALAFTDWFTANYDQISGERFLTPPPESGLTEPVPVFTELRRIALITAIAEKLRDQGVPMPFWMRNYEVRPMPFERFTPGLEVTRSNRRIVARVYGGVELSAEDKVVQNFVPRSDLSKLPRQERTVVREKIALADSLEGVVRDELTAIEPLEVRQFKHQGAGYQAAALPGAGTQALAPARLVEVDLAVPIAGGGAIRLVRSYNSFFNSSGPWGRGWALDLPRLEAIRMPVRREGNAVQYRLAYELITPLNSLYARFSRIETVPALNNSRLMVSDQPSDFFGMADGEPAFLTGPTQQLIRKDGGVWHFSEAGDLVATEVGGLRTVYERDGNGHLTRIVGLRGRQPMAFIELSYDPSGKLESATAKGVGPKDTESTVRYAYDASGRLATVTSESGRLGYRYQGAWVTAVTYAGDTQEDADDDPVIRRFEYDARGRLLSEIVADGTRMDYRVSSNADGKTVTATDSTSGTGTIRYDLAFRPLEARYADGAQAVWNYPAEGGAVLEVADNDGAAAARLTESADGRRRTLELDDGYRITSEFDAAGRMTALAENGRTVLWQEWSPDGRLRVAGNESQAEHFEYDADGLVSRVRLTPPGERGQFNHWQETRLDPAGRPIEVKDFRGLHQSMSYDDTGALAGMVTHREGNAYGFRLTRDDAGRLRRVQSSWGEQRYTYDKGGQIATFEMEKAGATAAAEWDSGLLKKVKQFDGGDLSLSYFEDGDHAGLLKQITTPNRLALNYRYDPAGRLAEVAVGNRYRMRLDYDAEGRLTGWRYQAARP